MGKCGKRPNYIDETFKWLCCLYYLSPKGRRAITAAFGRMKYSSHCGTEPIASLLGDHSQGKYTKWIKKRGCQWACLQTSHERALLWVFPGQKIAFREKKLSIKSDEEVNIPEVLFFTWLQLNTMGQEEGH